MKQTEIILPAFNRGFHLITHLVEAKLTDLPASGLIHLFIKHTSAGLCINENADPTVLSDFETVFNRMVPENQPYYMHTMEGSDDMPAHIKSVLSGVSVTIPITNGRLNLGTWQGIYLCEFRNRGGSRKLVATIIG
ncbi:MAG: secondary thiamine-phosphate synthase [Bacteroidetes bacterium HGW-Bacteroidetes-9]|jgi:secondary thiamine-phosphate synthase enzyme|nr:MAG: secondary thiamine-phosphate synthase [Bacteroidetes bacterium HGW-Bacteroidetes-9]